MNSIKTARGFKLYKFLDSCNIECSLQESSHIVPSIWLGVTNPKLTVFQDESKGKYIETEMPRNFSVDSRMHLTSDQVKELLPYLIKFAFTKELSKLNKDDISALFDNNSDCYADTWEFPDCETHIEGEVIPAMTKEKLIEVLEKINIL
jgi:hypothetical protein